MRRRLRFESQNFCFDRFSIVSGILHKHFCINTFPSRPLFIQTCVSYYYYSLRPFLLLFLSLLLSLLAPLWYALICAPTTNNNKKKTHSRPATRRDGATAMWWCGVCVSTNLLSGRWCCDVSSAQKCDTHSGRRRLRDEIICRRFPEFHFRKHTTRHGSTRSDDSFPRKCERFPRFSSLFIDFFKGWQHRWSPNATRTGPKWGGKWAH